MVIANLGSIAVRVLDRVESVPTNISGALISIIDDERLYVEELTGLSIGSTSIAEKYQPALTDLSIAKVLDLMQLEGGDASNIRLGDFSVSKGSDSNVSSAARMYRETAMTKLKSLGLTMRFRRIIS